MYAQHNEQKQPTHRFSWQLNRCQVSLKSAAKRKMLFKLASLLADAPLKLVSEDPKDNVGAALHHVVDDITQPIGCFTTKLPNSI